MHIQPVTEHKNRYLDLLLADEQEDRIDRYLQRGEMFILTDPEVKAECVVTREGDGVYALKSIAVYPEAQRRGYGRALIDFALSRYPDCQTLLVGTWNVPDVLRFYQRYGFREFQRVRNFFTDNYDHPIIDDGIQLQDMVYLRNDRRAVSQNQV